MEQEHNAQRLQNIDPAFTCDLVDIRVIGNRLIVHKLRCSGCNGSDKTYEFQSVYGAGKVAHVSFHIGGEVGGIEDIPSLISAADESGHTSVPDPLKKLRRGHGLHGFTLLD